MKETSPVAPAPSDPAILRGITVIELGGHLAGALCARLLLEQGAQVTRIERTAPRAGDPLDLHLNAAKRRLMLNLTDPGDQPRVWQLLRQADIIIENFSPGTLERLGLAPERIHAANPGAIILRLPGFASEDPEWRDVPAWESALSAFCGLYTDLNIPRAFLGLPPVPTSLPHCSVYGAVHAALAAVLALHARAGTGRGDNIEVPLAAAGLSAMGSAAMRIVPQPTRYDLPEIGPVMRDHLVPLLRRVVRRLPLSVQEILARRADRLWPAMMDSYRCADGRLLYIFAIDHVALPRRLLEALGVWSDLARAGLTVTGMYRPTARRNNLAESSRLSPAWQRRLRGAIAAVLRQKPAAVWEQRLNAAGIPCAVQRSTTEWLRQPELEQAGIVMRSQVNGHSLRHPGPALWFHCANAASPSFRETTISPGPVARMPRLAGLRVLDLSSMVAGPVCGRTLAEYGAEVIKIDSPHPNHGPRLACWYGVDVNQGKRSLLLDLSNPEGRAVLDRLMTRADILLHNFSDAACDRLRLHTRDLLDVNPRLLVTRISAIRGPRPGPFDTRKGYDPVLQAASGIMRRYGGDDHPLHHGIASCIDYLCGYVAALATALALFGRQRSGLVCEAQTSLAQAANLIQLHFAVECSASREFGPGGACARYAHDTWSGIFRARDGWVLLAAPLRAMASVCAVLGIPAMPDDDVDSVRERRIAKVLRDMRQQRIDQLLAGSGVAGIAIVPLYGRLRASSGPQPVHSIDNAATFRAMTRTSADGRTITTLLPGYSRSRHAPLSVPSSAPRMGQHTRDILSECGIPAREIEDMLVRGIASTGVYPGLLPD